MNNVSTILNKGVGQLGFVVQDLNATMQLYYNHFGIGDWKIYTYARPLLKFAYYHGEPIDYVSRIGLSYLGPTRIELIQNISGKTIYSDFIERHGYGLQHLGIYVEDMEEALKNVRQADFEVEMEGGGQGLDGDGRFCYLNTESTCGICYELIERPRCRPEPEAIYSATFLSCL